MLRSLSAKLLLTLSLALLSVRATEVEPLAPGTYYLNDFDELRSIGVLSSSKGFVGTLSQQETAQQWNVAPIAENSATLYTLKQGDLFARPTIDDFVELDGVPFAWSIERASSGSGCHIISTPLFSPFDNPVSDNAPAFFNWFIPGSSGGQGNIRVRLNPDNQTEICFTT